jgi:hypothetical protein
MFTREQAAVVLGMLERGDKQHDIAAHFGENPGRIIDVKFRRKEPYKDVVAAPAHMLPKPGGHSPYVQQLLDASASLADQLRVLDELIQTTPEGAPSIVETLSCELIEEVLKTRNGHNRSQRTNKIRQFMRSMQDGRFPLTGDSVKFGSNGELLDGQNRMKAALLCGIPLRTHVVFGVDPAAFRFIDSGAGRTGGDTFQVAGVANHHLVSQAVRWLMIFDSPSMNRGVTVSNDDLFEHYRKHVNKDLMDRCVTAARRVRRTLPKGSLVAMLYLFTKKDDRMTKVFVHDLEKQVRGAQALLRRVDNLRSQTGSRVKETVITALTVMAWNGYRAGRLLTGPQLRWTDDLPHPEIR